MPHKARGVIRRGLGPPDPRLAREAARHAWVSPTTEAPDLRSVREIVGDDPALWAEVAAVARQWARKETGA